MPFYNYLYIETKKPYKKKTGIQTIGEMEQFLIDNPELELGVTGAPGFGDSFKMGLKKPSDGFRDVLRKIKRKHKGSTINTF